MDARFYMAVLFLSGCGGGQVPDDGAVDGETIVEDGGVDVFGCMGDGVELACPPRECEHAVACSPEGECIYDRVHCGVPGRACPAETCEATMVDGAWSNACVVVADAACGPGGRCVGPRCELPVTGLTLRDRRFTSAELIASEGGLDVRAETGKPPPRAGALRTGTLRLSGGIRALTN